MRVPTMPLYPMTLDSEAVVRSYNFPLFQSVGSLASDASGKQNRSMIQRKGRIGLFYLIPSPFASPRSGIAVLISSRTANSVSQA